MYNLYYSLHITPTINPKYQCDQAKLYNIDQKTLINNHNKIYNLTYLSTLKSQAEKLSINNKNIIYYLHIHKTAGTNMCYIARNFKI